MYRLKTDLEDLRVDLIGLEFRKKIVASDLSKINGEISALKRKIIDGNKDEKKKGRQAFLDMIYLDMQNGLDKKEIAKKHGFTIETAKRHIDSVERRESYRRWREFMESNA